MATSHFRLWHGALARPALGWLLALALARLLLHLLTNGQYGFHRDELAVLDDANHLAWGYVAYPPLVPALAHASMQLFGDSLAAFRAPSALAQSLAVLFTGLIARELGGHRGAQVVAAVAVACVPFSMLAGSMLQYTSPDYLWWVLAAWLLPPSTVIVLGDDAEGVSDTPATCALTGRVHIPHGVENEESGHPDIYVCRDFRFDWAKAWPRMRHFG